MRRISEDEFIRAAVGQQIDGRPSDYPAVIPEHSADGPTRPLDTVASDLAPIEHVLAYLGTMQGENAQPIDHVVLQTIAALLERAEVAERAAATWEARAHHAELQIQAVEQRAMAAKARAEKAERRVETLLQQMNRPPKMERKPPVSFQTVTELRDPSGICCVCSKKAPPLSAARRDDLRVCLAEACRVEARRRDDAAKQRRYNARQSARKASKSRLSIS
jgi:hypothetical protein